MKLRILMPLLICTLSIVLAMNYYVRKAASTPLKYNGIVRLVSPEGDTFCTGFVVNEKTVMTAGHCALMESFSVVDKDLKFSVKAKFNFVNINSMHSVDVATIKGDFSAFEAMVVDFRQDAKIGSKVFAAGYGLGGALHISYGTVVGFLKFFIQTKELNLIQGMSGGPMIEAETGKVVGINSRVDEDSQQFTPMINLDTFVGL